jgi:two-component system NarL family sensor kinase
MTAGRVVAVAAVADQAAAVPATTAAPARAAADMAADMITETPAIPTEPAELAPAAATRGEWVVVAERGASPDRAGVPRLRNALFQVAAAALVVVAVVAIIGGLISRRTAESQSVHEAAQLTNVLADSVVQPALTDAMATSTTAAAQLDSLVRQRVLSSSLVRVKIWTPQGRIVYSDEPRLVGVTFGLDGGARAALSNPQVRAEITDLDEPENRFERGQGTMLEVYRPVWTPSGKPLLFETYFRYDQVSDRASQLWRGFAGITLSSIVAIVVLLVPLTWTLVARARRAHQQREAMLQRAMDASLDERRRIAATLHDGVVQELAAASFAVAGSAQDAATRGDDELAARLRDAAQTVRTSIGGMRSLLVDIYPPSLRAAGLAPALRDLAATVRANVSVAVDDDAAQALTPEQQEAVFRVAQECLRNAATHADAREITLVLQRDSGASRLEIADDGVGFDPSTTRPDGHFGLSLIDDLARGIGAELAVRSAPGAGTTWRLSIPT